jgi:fructose-bisphosphate aldolase class 1
VAGLSTQTSNPFAEELKQTAKYIAQRGRGILASDESNATTGKRLESVGVENTEENRRDWRQLLYTAPGLGQYISGAIMFEETLYQKARDGTQLVDVLKGQGIVPGIKVDTGLQMLPRTDGETSTQGLDNLGAVGEFNMRSAVESAGPRPQQACSPCLSHGSPSRCRSPAAAERGEGTVRRCTLPACPC